VPYHCGENVVGALMRARWSRPRAGDVSVAIGTRTTSGSP
jgi:hypothetical protein